MLTLEAIKYNKNSGELDILDQLKLPHETVYLKIENIKDGWRAINSMQVRGAPAIAIVGVLSVAVELYKKKFETCEEVRSFTSESMDYLITSRPTAVNIADAKVKLDDFCQQQLANNISADELKQKLLKKMSDMQEEDVAANRVMGNHGALDIVQRRQTAGDDAQLSILTHCNTGSLATGGYGTALGVVRRLHELGHLEHCFCTETRPYNQGSRLTAYELVYEKIPSTLICDDMVGLLMQRRHIAAVVVGADRIVANGDTANKIGTYQLAILAKHHGVLFYVAAPTTTIDFTKQAGAEIVIEERPCVEMTHVKGLRIAADGINCWNPAFDVTPNELITGGIITEHGVFKANELVTKLKPLLK